MPQIQLNPEQIAGIVLKIRELIPIYNQQKELTTILNQLEQAVTQLDAEDEELINLASDKEQNSRIYNAMYLVLDEYLRGNISNHTEMDSLLQQFVDSNQADFIKYLLATVSTTEERAKFLLNLCLVTKDDNLPNITKLNKDAFLYILEDENIFRIIYKEGAHRRTLLALSYNSNIPANSLDLTCMRPVIDSVYLLELIDKPSPKGLMHLLQIPNALISVELNQEQKKSFITSATAALTATVSDLSSKDYVYLQDVLLLLVHLNSSYNPASLESTLFRTAVQKILDDNNQDVIDKLALNKYSSWGMNLGAAKVMRFLPDNQTALNPLDIRQQTFDLCKSYAPIVEAGAAAAVKTGLYLGGIAFNSCKRNAVPVAKATAQSAAALVAQGYERCFPRAKARAE